MQFREMKTVIQVIRYAGYDAEKGNARVEQIGTINKADGALTLKEGVVLSEIEQLEVENAVKLQTLKTTTATTIENAEKAASALRLLKAGPHLEAIAKNDPAALWAGLLVMEKALKAAGFPRPGARQPAVKASPKKSKEK